MDSEPAHDDHSLHFFCNQKVAISNIWCRHIPNTFFHNLRLLSIYEVNGIRNSMSSSITKNLVNLQFPRIEGCQDMVEVIEDDKEVFITSLFPKLKKLTISKLQKLRSFCQWKHVLSCHRYAQLAFLIALLWKLSLFFYINNEPIEVKGLNDCIRDHFTMKILW